MTTSNAIKGTAIIVNLVVFVAFWVGLGKFAEYAIVTWMDGSAHIATLFCWGALNFIIAKLFSTLATEGVFSLMTKKEG